MKPETGIFVQLPYDRGYPYQLTTPGASAVINAQTAERLMACGVQFGSDEADLHTLHGAEELRWDRITVEGTSLVIDGAPASRISKKAGTLLQKALGRGCR